MTSIVALQGAFWTTVFFFFDREKSNRPNDIGTLSSMIASDSTTRMQFMLQKLELKLVHLLLLWVFYLAISQLLTVHFSSFK